jgi:hypothetical protein
VADTLKPAITRCLEPFGLSKEPAKVMRAANREYVDAVQREIEAEDERWEAERLAVEAERAERYRQYEARQTAYERGELKRAVEVSRG